MSLNRIEIIGHIGQDATVKDFNSNQVISFNVAVTETYLNKEKEKVTSLKTDIEDLKNRVVLTENTLKDVYRMMRMEGSQE